MRSLPLVDGPYSFVAEQAPGYLNALSPVDTSSTELFIQQTHRALEEINATAIKKITGLHDALEHLEKTPEDFRSLCEDNDVEALIKQIESSECEEKKAREYLSFSRNHLEGTDPVLARKLQEADENLYDIISLLQEIRWRIMVLHSTGQPGSDMVYRSAKEALDALWSS